MKNALKILIPLCVIAVSVIILIFVFSFKDKNREIQSSIKVTANDITMNVGETKNDFYTLKNKNATLTFETDKEDIITIDTNKIVALKPGVVTVTISSTLDGFTLKTSFTVKVLGSYTYSITAETNCYVENNILFKTATACMFKIIVYDKTGEIAQTNPPTINKDEDIICYYEFGNIVMSSASDCIIKFYYYELDYTITINIKNSAN